MKSAISIFIVLTNLLVGNKAIAQFQYSFDKGVPVIENEKLLEMPWAGGLDAGQYSQIDLNNDSKMDLVIFDRANNKLLCFLNTDNKYLYSPEYEHFFPSGLQSWVLLRDFNCDGKEDLFTSSVFGMSLYENVSIGETPDWDLLYATVFTEGAGGQINLQVNAGDLPGIADIDNDGDLDIMVFDFARGGGVQLHKNMSIENTGSCGLDLVLVTERYGDFEECTCEQYIFGTELCPTSGRLEHSGGKSIVSFDYTGTALHDLVIGQEDCQLFGYLENTGTNVEALMESVNFDFPNATNPVNLDYPAAYNVDVDMDGQLDILVTNNIKKNNPGANYSMNNWFYKKVGDTYSLISKSWLQEDMIDVGSAAHPAFSDIDKDGDEDLFIGNGSMGNGASLFYYINSGDALDPELELASEDYLNLLKNQVDGIRPQFLDLNNDGSDDLILSMVSDIQQRARVFWHTGNLLTPFMEEQSQLLELPSVTASDNLYFSFSSGGLNLYIGRENGSLARYINRGTVTNVVWELVTDAYLGLAEDFTARNISVFIADLNRDNQNDLVTYDDSGMLRIYSDHLGQAAKVENVLYDDQTLLSYNSIFGSKAKPVMTQITGAALPSIAIGLNTGGIQLLTNIEDDQANIEVPVRIALHPNPVSRRGALKIVANKAVDLRIVDLRGQTILKQLHVAKGVIKEFNLLALRSGVYIVEAVDQSGQKTASRFIYSN